MTIAWNKMLTFLEIKGFATREQIQHAMWEYVMSAGANVLLRLWNSGMIIAYQQVSVTLYKSVPPLPKTKEVTPVIERPEVIKEMNKKFKKDMKEPGEFFLQPLGRRILVEPDAFEHKGRTAVPDSAKRKTTTGRIIAFVELHDSLKVAKSSTTASQDRSSFEGGDGAQIGTTGCFPSTKGW